MIAREVRQRGYLIIIQRISSLVSKLDQQDKQECICFTLDFNFVLLRLAKAGWSETLFGEEGKRCLGNPSLVSLNRQPLFRTGSQRNLNIDSFPEYLTGQKLPDTTDEVIHMLCKEGSKSGKRNRLFALLLEQCNCVQQPI